MSALASPIPDVTDLLALSELARVVYKQCRDCNGRYRELSANAQQLSNILDDLQDVVRSFELRENTRYELSELGEKCNEVLVDLNTNLTKYKYMSIDYKATIDAQSHDDRDIKTMHAELAAAVTLVSAFYNSLITSAFIRVQRSFDQYATEIRSGTRDGEAVAIFSGDRDLRNASSWLQIRQDLEQHGLTTAMVEDHREFLIGKLITLSEQTKYNGSSSSKTCSDVKASEALNGSRSSSNTVDRIPLIGPQSPGGQNLLKGLGQSSPLEDSSTAHPPPYPGKAHTSETFWDDAPQNTQPGLIPAYTDLTTPMRSLSLNAPEPLQQPGPQGQRSQSLSIPQHPESTGSQRHRSQSMRAPQVVQQQEFHQQGALVPDTTAVRLPGIAVTAYESAIHSVKGNEQQKFAQAAYAWNQRRYAEAMRLLPLACLSVEDSARAVEMCAIARHCSAIHASYIGEFTVAKLHFLENVNHLGGPRSNNELCHELRVVGLRWLGDTCLQLGEAANALFVWALAIKGYSILASRNIKPWGGISKSLLFEFPRVLVYERDRFRFQPPNTYIFPEFNLQDREHALTLALQIIEQIKNACSGKGKFRISDNELNDFTRPPTSRTPFLFRSGPPVINHSSEWFVKVLSCDPLLDMENTISLALQKQPRPGSGLQYSPWTMGEINVRTTKNESLILNIFYREFSKDMASGLRLVGLRIVPEWNRLCCYATLGHENLVAMARLTIRVHKRIQKKSEVDTKFCIEYSYNTTEPSRPMAQPRSPTHESSGLEPWFRAKVENITSTMI